MTTKVELTGKTIRKRWFQRTYIEQFFRFSKHTLNIQKTKSTNVEEFDQNVSINFMKVFVCQMFKLYCRKQSKMCQKWSFEKIQKHLIYDRVEQTFLENILSNYDNLLQEVV